MGTRMNGVAIALDVAMLGEPGAFAASVADLADAITSQPSAGDVDTLLLPGERGDAIKRRRAVDGIPVPESTWKAQIGRASCRDRVCQYVEISVVAVSLDKKERSSNRRTRTRR